MKNQHDEPLTIQLGNLLANQLIDSELICEGCDVVTSLESGLQLACSEEKLFVIGGADIYRQSISLAEDLYITYVDVSVEGDRFFPEVDMTEWELVREQK